MNRTATALLALLTACGSQSAPFSGDDQTTLSWEDDANYDKRERADYGGAAEERSQRYAEPAPRAAAAPAPPPPPSDPGSGSISQLAGLDGLMEVEDEEEEPQEGQKGGEGDRTGSGPEVTTRAWFPETFLFEPQVVTDADGKASVTVTVPDRLTEWRVLGLAHAKTGAMAGDTLTFQGTLPVYVDPIVPPFLRAGDALVMPVQLVNTTGRAVTTDLDVSATGAGFVIGDPGSVSVAGRSNAVRTVELQAERAGTVTVRAALGAEDAVEQPVEIRPTGRPISDDRSGTLASPRSYTLTGPYDAEPGSTRARLVVYPGALAVLRAELSHIERRSGTANDGYALMLAGRGPELLANLNGEVDEEALRELRLVSTQRVMRAARSPSVTTSTLLAEAALYNSDSPVLARLGSRLLDQLLSAQRPDGTFSGGSGWTVQRLLVATADASATLQRSLPLEEDTGRRQRIQRALLMASSAYERLSKQTSDGYTAAAILAGGNVDGELAEQLRARVREAIVERDDGSRALPVGEGVLRADGSRPTEVEATALAALALLDDPAADGWRADLGATLLSAYSPSRGWGDGKASMTCLVALTELFDTPLPSELSITLKQDGAVLTEGVYDAEKLREVLVLDATGLDGAGSHAYTVEASPAVPGLGFSLSLQSWVPWEEPAADQGLEATLEGLADLSVGQPATLTLQAAAPSRTPFTIEHHLPAGVQADEDSLAALVSAGVLRSYHTEDGLIRMEATALDPGEALSANYTVIPTLGGTLQSGPLSLYPDSQESLTVSYPPVAWTIR